MAVYTLHIQGSIPVTLTHGEPVPQTQAALLAFYEEQEVTPFDLDNLELQLTPGVLPRYEGLADDEE